MAQLAERIRRNLIWLLLGAYAISVFFPGPGAAAAQFDLGEWVGIGGRVTAPLILVALLLYLAAMAVEVGELRVLLQRPWVWIAGLACVWIGPALMVALAGRVFPGLASGAAGGLLLGMTLVAAMPVANSAVAWAQQSGGSLPWSLGLVVLSILFTPLATPQLLRLSGMTLSGGEAEYVEQLVRNFSGVPFIVWVILPTVAGLATRRAMGAGLVARLGPVRQIASAAILLLLNYANGSLALPQFFDHPSAVTLAMAAVAAFGLAGAGVALATGLAAVMRLDHPARDAMRFGLSMKHTGLAFALANNAGLADQQEAMLLIVVATPTQHLVAALIDRLASSRVEAPVQATDSVPAEQ